MASIHCPIWGTPATETRDSDGDKIYVHSHRAGGTYSITGTASAEVRHLSIERKLRLTSWLCEQRSSGIVDPLITSRTLEEISARRLLATSQRIERALLFFNGLRFGDTLIMFPGEFSHADPMAGQLAALTESEDKDELFALFSILDELGFIRDTTNVLGRSEFAPTAQGWLKIEELSRTTIRGYQAFVAMWFHESTTAAYDSGIAIAIRNCGYEPVRIDNKEHANKIDDEIIAEIRRSRFVVADFTCEKDRVRGGVYFEAGFARGLSIPVIWTCNKRSLDDLHFDTRRYNHIVWETPDDLHRALEARIGAVIGDGPLPKPTRQA